MKNRLILLLVVLTAFTFVCAEQPPAASWIAFPEKSDGESVDTLRYLRKDFTVKGNLQQATIYHFTDDAGVVYLDGKALPGSRVTRPGKNIQAFEVTDLLETGIHAVGVRALNHGGPRGTILRLNLIYSDGTQEDIFSDESWGALATEMPGWSSVGFSGAVQEPVCFGVGAIPPWGTLIDMDFFYNADALATIKRVKRERDARIAALAEQISQEPREESKVIYRNGLPLIQIGEKEYTPMIYMSHFWQGFDSNPAFVKNVEHFRDAGIHLYGIGV